MNQFIDSNNRNKLELLERLNRARTSMSINELASETQISDKTVRKLIKELSVEFSETALIEVDYNGAQIKAVRANNLSILDIATNYLKASLHYKIIVDLFYGRLNRRVFCEKEFISDSLFKLKIKELKTILAEYSISLDSKLKIVGEELRIRNFFYYFFSTAMSDWPFDEFFQKKLDQCLKEEYNLWEKLNMINQRRFCLVLYISYIRNSNMCYINDLTLSNLEKEFSQIGLKNSLNSFFRMINVNKDIETEVSVACLFIFKEHLVPFKVTYTDEIQRKDIEKNVPFIKFSDILTRKVIEHFYPQLPYETFELDVNKCTDLLHMELLHCMLDIRDFFYVFSEADFYYKDTAEQLLFQQVEALYDDLMQDEEYLLFYQQIKSTVKKEIYLDQLYIMMYNIKNKVANTSLDKVKIYVQNSKKHVEELVIYKIKLIFSDRIEIMPTPYEENIDMIITDTVTNYRKLSDEQFVVMSTFSNRSEFDFLIKKITDKILKKFTYREI